MQAEKQKDKHGNSERGSKHKEDKGQGNEKGTNISNTERNYLLTVTLAALKVQSVKPGSLSLDHR
jgi:hypothetical protein